MKMSKTNNINVKLNDTATPNLIKMSYMLYNKINTPVTMYCTLNAY